MKWRSANQSELENKFVRGFVLVGKGVTPKSIVILSGRFLPYNPALKDSTRYLRSNPTKAEKKLWYEFLRKLSFMVYRQRPIDNFIVDFYLPMSKLVIEVDGDTHYDDNAIEYDQQRTHILQGYELKVVRFTNQEVLNNFEEVCKVITTHIQPNI